MVASWHAKLGKQITSSRAARDRTNKDKKPEKAIMLAGKAKAYVEMRCYLESKYQKCMPELLTQRQDEPRQSS